MKLRFVNLNTILLREVPGGTQIDLHVCVLTRTDEAEHCLKGPRAGWISSFEQLDNLSDERATRIIPCFWDITLAAVQESE
jgi:hypothetical protein